MDDVTVGVDADAFARDVAQLKASLSTGLASGAATGGQAIEASLARAVASGKAGFDDLRKTALAALTDIAGAALKGGIDALVGGAGAGVASGGGSLVAAAAGLLSGLPGRATGGSVSPGRAYVVGERGPEVFVPTSSGAVAAAGGGARSVNVAISVSAAAGEAPAALKQSGRQVARAVKAALIAAG